MMKEEFEGTKGVIRIRISKKNRQHKGQKLEDNKGVIRIRISKRKHITQWAKRKITKGQTTIYKTYTSNERSSNTNPT